jgi:UDP-glucose 4-epimerase
MCEDRLSGRGSSGTSRSDRGLRSLTVEVVITGAAGFLGSALAHELSSRGAVVHALVHPRTDTWRLDDVDDVHLHRVDLTDGETVARALTGIGQATVVHTASARGHVLPGSASSRAALWRDTVQATVTLLDELSRLDVRQFIHLGSSLEYRPSSMPLRESDPREPISARGAAKLAASIAVQQWAADCGVAVTELRIFRAYGPREAPDRLVPALVRALRTGEPVPTPPATTRRDMIHVDDVVAACLRSMECDAAGGEVFNVGFGDAHTVEEIIDVFEEVGGRRITRVPGGRALFRHDVEHWQADMGHTSSVLRWRPTIDLRQGAAMVLRVS